MGAKVISVQLYIDTLMSNLHERYPNEQFLLEEIDAIIQALMNSISWSALRTAQAEAQNGIIVRPVEMLETVDHFCTNVMSREEIVSRISDTSGLSDEISVQALEIIESITDSMLGDAGQIFIEHIGTIFRHESGAYSIALAADVVIQPDSGKGVEIPRSASASASAAN
jgi:hypothetical protein